MAKRKKDGSYDYRTREGRAVRDSLPLANAILFLFGLVFKIAFLPFIIIRYLLRGRR